MEEGDIGISGLDCVGECTLSIKEDGSSRSWFFSAEPRVFGVESGGPTDGILESGDLLVAIDGLLITTKEGGQRYANLEPGERIRLRYRRDGRVREASVRVEEGCLDPPNPAGMISRVPPPPPSPDEVRSVVIAVAPRVRVAPSRRPTATTGTSTGRGVSRTTVPRRAPVGILETTSPAGSLGIGISCTNCGTRTDEETGKDIWFFSGPLEVSAVNTGGPAAGVGIQRGDLIKAIDGNALDTDAGGLAFTRLSVGEQVQLTVVKRTGAEVQVRVVPEARRSVGALAPAVVRAPRAETAPSARPAVPPPTGRPSTPVLPEAPEGMPLRYSGGMDGVEVEVWGDPVQVSELKGTRTLYIQTDGMWIRITVPRRTLPPGGGAIGLGTPHRN